MKNSFSLPKKCYLKSAGIVIILAIFCFTSAYSAEIQCSGELSGKNFRASESIENGARSGLYVECMAHFVPTGSLNFHELEKKWSDPCYSLSQSAKCETVE